MVRKNRDSKFVIYQVLYIFVITVLAIKGAGLDLGEVISKKEAIKRSVRDSLVTVIDSLNAIGAKFDLRVEENMAVENVELKKKIESLSENMASLTKKIKETPSAVDETPVNKPREEVRTKEPFNSPLAEGQKFMQNTWNVAKNSGSVPAEIVDPSTGNIIARIAPGEQKKFDLAAQSRVIVRFNGHEEKVDVLPKRPPEIKIDNVSTKMNGSDVYVQDLQKTTVFKVSIISPRPEDLNIAFNGPITASGPIKDSKGNLVYNVSLRLAPNEEKFEEWMDKSRPLREGDGRYKVNFFFVAMDKITRTRVQVGDSFYFTSFQR
ncbi:MAG: hypothetical protein ACM3UR_08465 [Bacteroidota bacterium]|jgi:hypothetical protein|nr:hypothetical protein [Ignavibacteria bacterium]MCU7497897.1 hypothetical protein [Ignavibacteria bacterium]MCU7511178.1 hypothetical protein [Ignavibacteria bacterium]MCU7518724.1 hypothetical protein [Ignavibacteria bacterium]MCU7522873.1 hypothetical protein [Ignavibacteria bacterium]